MRASIREGERPSKRLLAVTVLVVTALALNACGDDDSESGPVQTTAPESPLADLSLIGVDFELDLIVLTNNGTDTIITEDLWVYQNGEASKFDFSVVEPRATIQFGIDEIGGARSSGGEIALFDSGSFSDANSMLDYVAWGTSGFDRMDVAIEALLWADTGTVPTATDSVVLVKADPTAVGSSSWEATSSSR